MDRLTFEGDFCTIAMCQENPCPYENSCTQREVWDRLKAYEDTGLEPEEIEKAMAISALREQKAKVVDFDQVKPLTLVDHGAIEQHWIPTAERMPKEDGKYLCVWQHRAIETSLFLNGHFSMYGENKDHLVTHWMPLPKPPKEDGNDRS